MKRKIEIELDSVKKEVKMSMKIEFKDGTTIEENPWIIKTNMTDEELMGYLNATEQEGRISIVGELNRIAALETAREVAWREKWKEIRKAQGMG